MPQRAEAGSEVLAIENCKLNIKKIQGKKLAPRFIFLNGVPVTSLIYDELAATLNRNIDASVELVDLPGTGLSRNSSYTWSASERCVHSFLKSQSEKFVLLVHDIAGPIALPILADTSIKFEGVVILNTILRPTQFKPVFPLSLVRTPVLGAVVSPLIPFFFFEKEMRSKGINRNSEIESSQIRSIYDDFSYSFGKLRLHRVMRGFELNEEREMRIQSGIQSSLPKLTIWGLSDPSLGTQFKYVSKIKNNTVVKLPHAKHFLMLDYAEELSSAIQRFSRRL